MTTDRKRNQLMIMVDVLFSLKEPRLVTHLMYLTNLSYKQLRSYVETLTNIGLVEEFEFVKGRHKFRITNKGMNFIDLIANDNYLIQCRH
ncbi:MAG: hypothetical protein COA77_06865 [Thaumarchaeota archaeon]|nr:MAG: hypothetical protein COA77_06865 [Nitrososphaerota archaeon]